MPSAGVDSLTAGAGCQAAGSRSFPTVSGVILVAEYDPAWPQRFSQLRREYAMAMAAAGVPVVAIEHVGSTTAVPGLAAKPVIDCGIVVAEPDVPAASAVLGRARVHAPWRARHPAEVGIQGARAAGRNQHVCRCRGFAVALQPPRCPGYPAG
jgi:GrpB-like predicted nucleotidyltransferase (UPF0157 family)